MKVAVVILNWNGKQLLEQFLPSVVQYSKEATVYVADNASTDDSVAFVKEQFPIVQKECPSMSPQNVMREIAKNWKQSKKSSELKSKTFDDEPAEEVEDNSIAKNHTFFVFELFNSLFNVK